MITSVIALRDSVSKDQHQFIACRGLLRHFLSLYVHKQFDLLIPQVQCIRKAATQKWLHGDEDLRFNYSHSEGYAVFAFAKGKEIGVDVERIRPRIAEESIPEQLLY